ncbi:glycosyltransferase family 25 protein [bacterium]|nr:glycosyltransferase family 25 protein [Candidatus Elulimicrobium humile]
MVNVIPKTTRLDRFEDIQNVLYINLDERPDRKEKTEQEFSRIGLKAQRVPAIKKKRGQLGCTLSHIKCLEMAKANNWDHVMICEDDILFAKDAQFVRERINTFLSRHKDWDIIVLGILIGNGIYIDDSAAWIKKSWCTTCYIVRKEYYDVLLYNFKTSTERLQSYIIIGNEIDQIWNSLQRRDKWMTILPIIVTQVPSKSNINESNDFLDNQKWMYNTLKNIQGYPESERVKSANLFY